MKYMLLIYSPESAWSPEEWNQCVGTSLEICQELAAKGQFLAAAPLHPVATAVTLRSRNGQRLVTAGPFAETAEQLGGYYLIDVENLDEAIAIAGRLPPAKKGTVEIRPLARLDGLPPEKLTPTEDDIPAGLRKFMLLAYDDENHWATVDPAVLQAAFAQAVALTHKLDARRQYLSASPLHPTSTATSVRVRNGKRSIMDGPFAETREVMGGYYLILARDHDEALQFALEHPGIGVGAMEIREVFDIAQMG
jgi:hypothetical protein